MINTNELMIGNWVMYKNTPLKVVEILSYTVSVDGGGLPFIYDKLDPIPLTPELLEKCGFKRFNSKYKLIVDDGLGSILTVNEINGDYSLSCFPIEFQYLHILQNLVKLLTGKELEVNF
jgi:hypothetical protein